MMKIVPGAGDKTVKNPLVSPGRDGYNGAELLPAVRRRSDRKKRGIHMTKDLTRGDPMRLILGFALPTLFGMLFQQLYNLVDTKIGRAHV